MGGDIDEGAHFHASAYTGEGQDNGREPSRPQEDSPPIPDEIHKKIYEKATEDMFTLMKDPKIAFKKMKIATHNDAIREHNKKVLKKPQANLGDNIINLNALCPQYEMYSDLLEKPYTRELQASFQTLNKTLRQLNTRHGYPSTWIAEVPPQWPQEAKNSSQLGKGKSAANQAGGQGATAGEGNSAANQARGQGTAAGKDNSTADQAGDQGAAATPFDPDPTFRGVRTRDNEPILGYRKVSRDGRQYLVQTDGPENPAFEFRSQAGDDGVDRRVERAYEASPGAVLLGEIDKTFTKEDAHRYVGIKGVAYKPIQVASNDRDRYPVTAAWAVFQNPAAEHWVYRTTVRRLAGKRDADLDIHDWSKSRGLVPSDQAPPRNYLIKNDAYEDVFPRRSRAAISAVDESSALPEKEIKTLTNGQEDLRTRLDKLEKDFKDEQKKSADWQDTFGKKMDTKFAEVIAAITNLNSGSSQGQVKQA